MKLIIDIPEHIYNSVKTENCFLNGFEICETKNSIANGIPLEDIKKEIRASVFDIQATSDKYFDGVDDVMDIVDSILDKYIKEI